MREFLKVLCVLVFCAAAIIAALGWASDKPDALAWTCRILFPVIAVVPLIIFVWMDRRRDLVPDYLSEDFNHFWEQNGLCFQIVPHAKPDGSFWFNVYYQNRHENPCLAHIALRPSSRSMGVDPVLAVFECGPAAFGVAMVPLAFGVSARRQICEFKIGATVGYPQGKGKMLRFRDGNVIRTDFQFRDDLFRAAQIFMLLSGGIMIKKHAKLRCELPGYLKPDLPVDLKTHTKTLWKLGDPPL